MIDYLRDPAAIYRRSFEIIRAETDFSGLPADAEPVATRIIHACGMPEIARDLRISVNFVSAARGAISSRMPVFVDAEMVRYGIINKSHDIVCTLNDPRVREIGLATGNTRSAAAVHLWRDRLEGALCVIGNAPTALFALLEMMDAGSARPAAIIGFPVGFVGAAESKDALHANPCGVPYATLLGRRGGSAMAAAVVNAMTRGTE